MYALIMYLLGVLTAVGTKKHDRDHGNAEPDKDCKSFPVPLTVIAMPPTPSDEERAKQKKKESREKWKFRAEIGGLIVLAVYTGFTIAIWRANNKAAVAAQSANQFALRVFEANERAVVMPDQPIEFLDQGVIKVTMRNSGKRPAGPFFLWISPSRWKTGESRPIMQVNTESGTFRPDARRIPAGGHLDFIVPVEGVTKDDVVKIRGGSEQLIVYVKITYDNGFGKQGKFDAAFQYIPRIGWVSNTPTFGVKGAEKVPDTPEQ